MPNTNQNQIELASFSRRLGAGLVDAFVISFMGMCFFILAAKFRLAGLLLIAPCTAFLIWYKFLTLKKYGATPGQLLLGIRVRKTDSSPIDTRSAFLRCSVDLSLTIVLYAAVGLMMLQLSGEEFAALPRTSTLGLISEEALRAIEPTWYNVVNAVSFFWFCSEYVVLFTNRKRQAFQDMMAGTIVVRTAPANCFSSNSGCLVCIKPQNLRSVPVVDEMHHQEL